MILVLCGDPGKSYCRKILCEVKKPLFHLQRRDFITIKLIRFLQEPVRDYFISPLLGMNKKYLYSGYTPFERLVNEKIRSRDPAWPIYVLRGLRIDYYQDSLVDFIRDNLKADKDSLFKITERIEEFVPLDLRTELGPFYNECVEKRTFMVYYAYHLSELEVFKMSYKNKIIFIEMRKEFKERTKARRLPEEIRSEMARMADFTIRNDYEFNQVLLKKLVNTLFH